MNPHGRQYRLGWTINAWARVQEPTRRQRLALGLAYRGLTPLVYSRYGYRRARAPWPGTRIIVKDPFALLSIPFVVKQTGALAVVVYRHPGAVLASYRRMGWRPDLGEVSRLVDVPAAPPSSPDVADPMVADMARFWTALNGAALADLAGTTPAIVVSHEEVATGGEKAQRTLLDACGLGWDEATRIRIAAAGSEEGKANSSKTLHDLNRSPAVVAAGWRNAVTDAELDLLERVAGTVMHDLAARRLHVAGH